MARTRNKHFSDLEFVVRDSDGPPDPSFDIEGWLADMLVEHLLRSKKDYVEIFCETKDNINPHE